MSTCMETLYRDFLSDESELNVLDEVWKKIIKHVLNEE